MWGAEIPGNQRKLEWREEPCARRGSPEKHSRQWGERRERGGEERGERVGRRKEGRRGGGEEEREGREGGRKITRNQLTGFQRLTSIGWREARD